MDLLEPNKLLLFIAFVIPGFVTLKVYELLIPGEVRESSKQLIDAVAYSCFNYALLFAPVYLVETHNVRAAHNLLYVVFYLFVLFIAPAAWPFIWIKWRKSGSGQSVFRHPTDRPWDFLFGQRKRYWIVVTLKDGKQIGGLFDDASFASSAPAPDQIYLQEAWHLNSDGGFEKPKVDTAGVMILDTEITTVELFKAD